MTDRRGAGLLHLHRPLLGAPGWPGTRRPSRRSAGGCPRGTRPPGLWAHSSPPSPDRSASAWKTPSTRWPIATPSKSPGRSREREKRSGPVHTTTASSASVTSTASSSETAAASPACQVVDGGPATLDPGLEVGQHPLERAVGPARQGPQLYRDRAVRPGQRQLAGIAHGPLGQRHAASQRPVGTLLPVAGRHRQSNRFHRHRSPQTTRVPASRLRSPMARTSSALVLPSP